MDTKYLFLVIIIVAICRLAFVSANNAKLKKRYGDGELLLVDKFQFIGGLDLPQMSCASNLFALSHYHAGKRSGV